MKLDFKRAETQNTTKIKKRNKIYQQRILQEMIPRLTTSIIIRSNIKHWKVPLLADIFYRNKRVILMGPPQDKASNFSNGRT